MSKSAGLTHCDECHFPISDRTDPAGPILLPEDRELHQVCDHLWRLRAMALGQFEDDAWPIDVAIERLFAVGLALIKAHQEALDAIARDRNPGVAESRAASRAGSR